MSSLKVFFFLFLSLEIFCEKEEIPSNLYHKLNPFTKDCPYDASQPVDSFSIEMAMYYSWFTSYAYCRDSTISKGECCKDKFIFSEMNWTLVDHNFHNPNDISDEENNYVLFQSDLYKKFIIGFPGTRGGFWQIVDEVLKSGLVAIEDKENPIKVMDYTIDWFDKVKDMIYSQKNLELIRSHPDYQIILTGHSLGGSTATYAAFIEEYYPEYSFRNNRKPLIISYGQNRLGNKEFVEYIEEKTEIFRVKRRRDFVTHIPFCSYAPLTTDPCEKGNDKILHPGKYFQIDNDIEYIHHCLEEYLDQEDDGCLDKVDLGDIDISHHLNYFSTEEKINDRC